MENRTGRGSIFSNRIDIAKPGGGMGSRPLRSQEGSRLDVHESSAVDRSNEHIVVRLTGAESKHFGVSEPVVLYKRNS